PPDGACLAGDCELARVPLDRCVSGDPQAGDCGRPWSGGPHHVEGRVSGRVDPVYALYAAQRGARRVGRVPTDVTAVYSLCEAVPTRAVRNSPGVPQSADIQPAPAPVY